MFYLVVKDRGERMGVQPWWWEDVRAALALQQESQPQWDIISMRWYKRFDRALCRFSDPTFHTRVCKDCARRGAGGVHTPRSSSPPSLCRGMTVTSSISHRKAISGGVSPGGRGNAIIINASRRDLEV